MTVDEKEQDAAPAPKPDPTPLATGVWTTEATGFASVPPRAQSDLADVCEENEKRRKEEGAEPRIERYPER